MPTKWLKNTMVSAFAFLGLGLLVGLTQAGTLEFTGVTETGVQTSIDNSYFYSGCYTPVKILVNPEGVDTQSVDAKFFGTGSFGLQENSDYLGFIEGVFSTYLNTRTVARDSRIGEGVATSGDYNGRDYYYINAYTDTGSFVSGSAAQHYATIYVLPYSSETSVFLDFYNLSANDDDSNISSGTNNYTQYEDALTSVDGTGSWTIVDTNLYLCRYNPFVYSGTYQSTLATNLQTGVDDHFTLLAAMPAYRLLDPTAANYSGTMTHMAGYDYTTGDYTSDNSWNIWTNQTIVLTLTGNEYLSGDGSTLIRDIRMVTGTFASPYLTLSGYTGPGLDDWAGTKTIEINGNIETGIAFYNRIGNQGSYYLSGSENYFSGFMIDVFRYDTAATRVTTGLILTGDGYAVVGLSGYASTAADAGFHADFTTDDDKFRIIGFSGTNTTKYLYDTTTGYNDTLNSLYVAASASAQSFNMTKTGNYVLPPNTLTTTDNGALVFTESWSGFVYYSDIAGNVSGVWIDVTVEPITTFTIYAEPAYRDTVGAGDLTMTGVNIWFGYYNGASRVFTHNSATGTDSQVPINSAGTGTVDMVIPSSGSTYVVALKGSGYLSVGFTGVWRNDITHFDFRSGALNSGTHTAVYGDRVYGNTGYILRGDVEDAGANYDLIETATEITVINPLLTVGVATPDYRFDADLNDVINAVEQAIVIYDDTTKGFIRQCNNGDLVCPTQNQFLGL